jgi:tRNA (guanine10-N2)-methyltransferase
MENLQSLPVSFLNPLSSSRKTWSLQIESFGKTFKLENKNAIRTLFQFLHFEGNVSLQSPEIDLHIIFDFTAVHSNQSLSSIQINDPEYFGRIESQRDAKLYFGRRVFDSREMKKTLAKFNLQKRLYIGPTSLDHVLSMILANLAQVRPGMLAYEPFMGTGSIPIALEHFGCFCIGSDIDPRVLRGEMYAGYSGTSRQEINEKIVLTEQERQEKKLSGPKTYRTDYNPKKVRGDVRSNFDQYQLPQPELIRMDQHLLHRHFHSTSTNFFDVIVTDPPYGIRAGARKSGKRNNECNYQIHPEKRLDHIPSTQNYPVEEVMLDLLHNAAETLVM